MMVKSWKTSAVGWSQLVLGLVSFVLFAIGKIDYIALGGSIGFIVWIGGIIGNIFAKDSNVTHSGIRVQRTIDTDHVGNRPDDR